MLSALAARAGAAAAPQLERHALDRKFGLARPSSKPIHGHRLVELSNGAAIVANGKHCRALVARVTAGDKGVDGFEAMRLSIGNEAIQRAIDRLRREACLVAEFLDQLVRAHRPANTTQGVGDHLVLIRGSPALGRFARHSSEGSTTDRCDRSEVYIASSPPMPTFRTRIVVRDQRLLRAGTVPGVALEAALATAPSRMATIAKPPSRRYKTAISSKTRETAYGTLGGRADGWAARP